MEFHEKLKALRRAQQLTQEELAARLFVTRTAVSKWEQGRGYPNLSSLKTMADVFGITLDELLSADELVTVAEAQREQTVSSVRDRVFGLLDVATLLLLFLPLLADRVAPSVSAVSLIAFGGRPYVKLLFCILVSVTALCGVITLALQGCRVPLWIKSKTWLSLSCGAALVLLFTVALQPYAAVFSLTLLSVKGLLLIKRP